MTFSQREVIDGRGEITAMTTPKVTEIRRPLEPVTPDPFIARPLAPRPA
jgi:hypothetical protein